MRLRLPVVIGLNVLSLILSGVFGSQAMVVSAAPLLVTPTTIAEVEANGTPATATAISLTNRYAIGSGNINPNGDVDFWSFTAPAGSRVWIAVDGGASSTGYFDSVATLYAGDGVTQIETDDDDGTANTCDNSIESNLGSVIAGARLTAGGTYYVRVSAYASNRQITPYRLYIGVTPSASDEAEANNTSATATSLVTAGAPMGVRNAALNTAGDTDFYSIAATAGDVLFLALDGNPERDVTQTDADLALLGTNGTTVLITTDSDDVEYGGESFGENLCYTITTSGTYYVRVRDDGGTATGTYAVLAFGGTVTDTALSGLSAATTTPDTLGQTTTLTASVAGGTNATYQWNFGDGSPLATGAVVTRTYAAVGVYTAVVTATNYANTTATTTTITITDVAITGLTAGNNGPTTLGAATAFTAAVTAGTNVTYTWAFGDGVTGAGAAPSHTYAAPGTYTATVTAANSLGAATATTTVTVNDVAITGLTASNSGPTVIGAATAFTATVTAGTNVTYTWDFGDGATATGATAARTYAAPGTYTATVTAANSLGMATATTTVVVTNLPPTANAGADQTVTVGAAVTLDASLSIEPDGHTPLAYLWTQTSGPAVALSDASAVAPTFTAPATPATLIFSLVVTDSTGLADTTPDEVTITVANTAITGLTAGNDGPTTLGAATAFTAAVTAGTNVTYTWDFGDGATGAGASATRTYAAPGTYTATVTAANSLGTATATTTVVVTNLPPTADAGADQTVTVDAAVALNGAASTDPDGHTPLAYLWTQTSGPAVALSDAAAVAPTFTAPATPATLTFSLVVTDSTGLADATPDEVTITIADAAITGLTAGNDGPTTLGAATAFTAAVTAGTNVTYTWDFGDGATGTGTTASRTYAAPGTYTATVTATNGEGSATATTTVTVNDVAIAGLTAGNDGPTSLGNATAFTAAVTAGTNVTYTWDFGDGATGAGATASRTYTATGTYTATVTAANGQGATTATTTVVVTNLQPTADAGPDQTVTVDAAVTLDASLSAEPDGHTPLAYLWTQTSGPAVALSNAAAVAPTFTAPATPATLTFSLIVTDSTGLADATPDEVTITVADVAITGLTVSNSGPTTLGNTTAFTAAVTAGTNVTYTWAFGDGATGAGATPSLVYAATGTYTATVTAANSLGAVTATTTVVVTNLPPTADAGADQTVTVGAAVTLNGAASADPDGHIPLTAYQWTQTGGPAVALSNASAVAPTFTAPATPATLIFSLVVTDSAGLADATPDEVTITVADAAITGLTAANSSPTTLGAATAFTAAVSAGTNVTYTWAFGDGATATGATASRTYAAAGIFTATVTAANGQGAVTATTTVTVTTVNQAPAANAGADQSVNVGAAVTLNGAASTDPDGHTPLAYRWAQVSGPAVTLSNAAAVAPTFTAPATPATLTFSLVVTDSTGLADATPDLVVITVTDVAITGLNATAGSPSTQGQAIAFTAAVSTGTNVTYTWAFGDGATGAGAAPSHTYAAAGTYTVTVTATNSRGSVTTTLTVTVAGAQHVRYLPILFRFQTYP